MKYCVFKKLSIYGFAMHNIVSHEKMETGWTEYDTEGFKLLSNYFTYGLGVHYKF
jgi:hypothetical protein